MAIPAISVSFTGNEDQQRKVSATDVGVGTGAAFGGVKYFKRFKNFGKAGDIVQLSTETTKQIKQAANATTQVKSLWGRMFENAKQYKQSIVNWAQKTAVAKWAKPIVESKAFAKVSGIIGGATAAFVFISGIGEMGETYSRLANKNV